MWRKLVRALTRNPCSITAAKAIRCIRIRIFVAGLPVDKKDVLFVNTDTSGILMTVLVVCKQV